ncbi:MAG: NAD(P)H nitroreductase [Spongiibacteraceae bacterium]|jgi:nitroreductase|nr:NAD(P)H nitroreductase [Spongiibacteraceae bacterium]
MDAITLLTQRASAPRLAEPAPHGEALQNIIAAAVRAPDHARLRPWRLITIEGDARGRLGELFEEALLKRDSNASEEQRTKARNAPLRAPLLIAVVVRLQEHPKVPAIEQWLSAGCVAHAVLLAAQAQGFGGMWRTGEASYDRHIASGLGLGDNEELAGFIYLGTPLLPVATAPREVPAEFVTRWS